MSIYYVDQTGGDDSKDGLSQTISGGAGPWKTIAKVNGSTFSAGDSILFKKGEVWRYTLHIASSGSTGNPITYGAYGSGAKPIIRGDEVLSSWTVESALWYATYTDVTDQVFFDNARLTKVALKASLATGTWWWDAANTRVYIADNPAGHVVEATNVYWSTGIWNDGKDYVIIEDLDIRRAVNGISITGTVSNLTIRRCSSTYNSGDGIGYRQPDGFSDSTIGGNVSDGNVVAYNGDLGIVLTNSATDCTISYNDVHHNCQFADIVYAGGIYAWSANTTLGGLIIEHNQVYSNGSIITPSVTRGIGIWLDSIGGPTCIIRYNNVYDNYGHGIHIEASSGHEVYYNQVWITSAAVIAATAYPIYVLGAVRDTWPGQADNNKVYNNTMWGDWPHGIRFTSERTGAIPLISNNICKNNIVLLTGGAFHSALQAYYGGENDGTWGSGNVYEYNNFGPEATNYIWWGTGNASTVAAFDTLYGSATHTVAGDPVFVSTSIPDFSLQSSSPAINSGIDVGLTKDFAGKAVGGTPDIGAFEFQTPAAAPIMF